MSIPGFPRRPPRPSRPPGELLDLARSGPAPLRKGEPANADRLDLAIVIPSFRRGSGGHQTIVHLAGALRGMGHQVALWLEDHEGRHAKESAAIIEKSFRDFFAPDAVQLHPDFGAWRGADIVVATGWQTVARALLLSDVGARAYLVQDHEPDFYAASAERLWATQTYREPLHCIAASQWLADLLRSRYGASAGHFDCAVDHTMYRPREVERRDDLVVFYARSSTPRRAVPLGLLALAELARRRPGIDIVLYGGPAQPGLSFAHRNLGVLSDEQLAVLYSEATIGVVLSLTNPSLVGLDMMACGLPCVELASDSMLATFGRHGPLALAEPDPLALCDAIERLLDDHAHRRSVGQQGIELVGSRTWGQAARDVEAALRTALTQSHD
jgi:glycosyltransferase involved in cell wall biosynthesis